MEAFESLRAAGKLRHLGASNFDVADLEALWRVPYGPRCAVNQVSYSLGARGIEHDLLTWQRRRGMPLMAYSPIDQGALATQPRPEALARRIGVTAAQLALAWAVRNRDVVAIPKARQEMHLRDNIAAGTLVVDDAMCSELDALFQPPRNKQPLAMT